MDFSSSQIQKRLLNCSYHNKNVEFIYLKNDNISKLACSKCLVENQLEYKYIIEIEQLIQSEESTIFKQLPLGLSEQLYSDLMSTKIQGYNKQQVIDSITALFDIYENAIVRELNKSKKQLILHIGQMEAQRYNTIETYNNVAQKQALLHQILQCQNDPSSLDNYLKQFISTKSNSSLLDNNKIQEQLNQLSYLNNQFDLELVDSQLLTILETIKSTNILIDSTKQQQHHQQQQQVQQQEMSIPEQPLIEEKLIIISLEKLTSIPNLIQYQNIEIKLESLSLSNQHMKTLTNSLKQCQYLDQLNLNLSSNTIDDVGIKELSELFNCLPQVTALKLYLDLNQINKLGLQYLTGSLKSYSNLQTLDLGLNETNILDEDLICLIEEIKSKKQLTTLNLGLKSIRLGRNMVKSLSDSLKSLTMLFNLQLNLSNNSLVDEDIIQICGIIESFSSQLKVLYLWLEGNNIGDVSIQYMINSIQTCSNLNLLMLNLKNNNPIKDINKIKSFKENIQQICKKLRYHEIRYDNL